MKTFLIRENLSFLRKSDFFCFLYFLFPRSKCSRNQLPCKMVDRTSLNDPMWRRAEDWACLAAQGIGLAGIELIRLVYIQAGTTCNISIHLYWTLRWSASTFMTACQIIIIGLISAKRNYVHNDVSPVMHIVPFGSNTSNLYLDGVKHNQSNYTTNCRTAFHFYLFSKNATPEKLVGESSMHLI